MIPHCSNITAHQNPVAVYDGVETMSDCEHGAVSELASYGVLDQLVCPAQNFCKNWTKAYFCTLLCHS